MASPRWPRQVGHVNLADQVKRHVEFATHLLGDERNLCAVDMRLTVFALTIQLACERLDLLSTFVDGRLQQLPLRLAACCFCLLAAFPISDCFFRGTEDLLYLVALAE